MPITRNELYEQVWAEPMTKVAARYQVSSSFLARVCSRLNVPRPPRGHWAKRKAGERLPQPELPEALPSDEVEWIKDGDPIPGWSDMRSRPQVETPRPRKRRREGERPTRHPLLSAVREYFDAARVGHGGYLRPFKRLLVDIFVSKSTLSRALDLANALFLSFDDYGYQVALAPRDRHFNRPELDQREHGGSQTYGLDSWRPDRPTVVFIGPLAFGLTLYEMTENVEARYVEGKWVRASEAPLPKRRGYQSYDTYTSKSDLPSGRLALRSWCASGWTSWETHWREAKPGELDTKFNAIRRTLEDAVPTLTKAIDEAQRKADEERKAWELQRQEEERQAAERRKAEAIKESRAHLLAIVDRWALARNLETFFTDAEDRVEKLDGETRASLASRLQRARGLIGGTDPLKHFSHWKAPEDLCADFQPSGASREDDFDT